MDTKSTLPSPTVSSAHTHASRVGEPRQAERPGARTREGLRAGLLGATGVWLWLLVSDWLARRPFSTPVLLGRGLVSLDAPGARIPMWAGVLAFTVAHYALWIGVCALAVRAARTARRTSSVLLFALVIFVLLQFLFTAVTAIMAQGQLGAMAWRDMLIGNVIGWTAALSYIVRRHPELHAELARSSDGDG